MNATSATPVTPGLFIELEKRGLVKQTTHESLKAKLDREPITLYCGFDPTSDSLHVGSLLPLLTMRRFQQAGHRVIALVGGATGMIGDPSGKSSERQLLSTEQLARNQVGITRVIQRFLQMSGPNAARVVNNYAWFQGLTYLEFLRDVGKHFTVNHMVAKESVRARLEDRDHGISYTEFSYMLLQAYDYYHLHEKENCSLQIGGSDQWGNITAGTDLIRKMKKHGDEHHEVFGMTFPLVMKSDGTKFGKTESGSLWLDAEKTSPYQFYQYFIQTPDTDVMSLLRFFTFLPLDEYARLEELTKSAPEKREAQKMLAQELTKLVHGDAELAKVTQASSALFSSDIRTLNAQALLEVFKDAPSIVKSRDLLSTGYALIDALVESGLAQSKGAARKEIDGGGVYVNNARIQDSAAKLGKDDLIANEYIALRKGKKNYALIRFSS